MNSRNLLMKINLNIRNRLKNYFYNLKYGALTKLFIYNDKREGEIFYHNYLFFKQKYLGQKDFLEEPGQLFLLPAWADYNKKIKKYFLNDFSMNFLSQPVITETMFIKPKWQKRQLKYLETKYPTAELKKLLLEDKFGQPIISSYRYRTSANTIHHLNHLALFADKTKGILKNVKNVIEWGGGYGNMAKIFLRINSNVTYTIIDSPIFIFIQAIYLSSIFGREKINIITKSKQEIKNNLINLIPLNPETIKNIDFGQPDIFISTWALSESNEFSQNIIEQLNYFNSKHLLIAHQSTSPTMPFADNIINKISKYEKLYHEKIPYIGGANSYLFAKKI